MEPGWSLHGASLVLGLDVVPHVPRERLKYHAEMADQVPFATQVIANVLPDSTIDDEIGLVAAAIEMSTGVWEVLGGASSHNAMALFQGVSPTEVPEDRRLAVAELVSRINRSTELAHFEIDMDDGLVFCSTAVDLSVFTEVDGGMAAAEALFSAHVAEAIESMELYQPAILVVTHGDTSPAEAVRVVETR